ncbi:hypothetical protein [Micromonospora sp. NPDC023633]|uniref:hypothetical protein n=1 Tax=Micromonospora sp. NPDC023633 TaxID=3154320 RepID=UPI0033BFE43C
MTGTGSGVASGTESGVGCCGTADSNRAEAEALRRMGITRPPAELPARDTSGVARAAGGSGTIGSTPPGRRAASPPGGRIEWPRDGPSGDQLG